MTPKGKDTLKQPTQTQSEPEDNHDSVSTFLYFFGTAIILVMCIIGLIILSETHIYSVLQPETIITISCFVLGLFFGLVLIGIGRIIKVLQK